MSRTIKLAGIGLLLALVIALGCKPAPERPVPDSRPAASASDPVMRPYCFACATPDDEKSCAARDASTRYSVEITPIGENRYACCPEGLVPTIVDPDGGMLSATCKPAP